MSFAALCSALLRSALLPSAVLCSSPLGFTLLYYLLRGATEDGDERAPYADAPPPVARTASSRLAVTERHLADVTAQRDQALDLLAASRHENARLGAELERAQSYRALYTAAYHVRGGGGGKGKGTG